MKTYGWHYLIVLLLFTAQVGKAQDKLEFDGQLSGWANYSSGSDLKIGLGARYIPELNSAVTLKNKRLLDFEVSANIFGSMGVRPFDSVRTDGNIQPYRAWVRYSAKQYELRLGLQKINFGAASMLRPLRWFDQVDPRDPLQLTQGVWGALGRYYFLNNANIWLWVLYGNEDLKGWERTETYEQHPEFGGRIQHPVPHGEVGLSYHHRTADSRNLGIPSLAWAKIPENRIGIDGKWDVTVGVWVEGSWTHKSKDIGLFTNQTLLNAGIDYTFGIGNGMSVVAEQLLFSYDQQAFAFSNTSTFTATNLSYPIGVFDNLSAVFYYDWTNNGLYSFLNWQRQLDKLTFYIMAFWNPGNRQVFQQNDLINTFAGKGIQFMLVFNH